MSANWSWEDTERSCKVPCNKWWRTKWQSISICLVRSWKTSLWAIWMALRLSQWIETAVEKSTLRSWRSQHKQMSSAVVSASAWYSASVLEWAITDCFLLRQEMRESPRRKEYAVVFVSFILKNHFRIFLFLFYLFIYLFIYFCKNIFEQKFNYNLFLISFLKHIYP